MRAEAAPWLPFNRQERLGHRHRDLGRLEADHAPLRRISLYSE